MAATVDKTMRWVRLGSIGFVLVVGWLFIAWQNEFHVTPPLVFVGLGYFAVVMTTYNLWRTGAAAVAPNEEDDGDASWGKPTGAQSELEREKKTLLKAIKEAEFDHAMGKLSKADVDQMIGMYRARAIDVIKELEQLELGAAGTVRERILREVKARAALDGKLAKDDAKPVEPEVPEVPGVPDVPDVPDVKAEEPKAASEEPKKDDDVKDPTEAPATEAPAAVAAASEPVEPAAKEATS